MLGYRVILKHHVGCYVLLRVSGGQVTAIWLRHPMPNLPNRIGNIKAYSPLSALLGKGIANIWGIQFCKLRAGQRSSQKGKVWQGLDFTFITTIPCQYWG